jgi:hypothetical protein
MKKNRIFIYMMWQDLLLQMGMLLFVLLIALVMYAARGELRVLELDIMVLILPVLMIGPMCLSYGEMEKFFTFHYSRRRFYRYQVWLSILRAAEMGVVWTTYHFVWQKNFIYEFMEDTDDTISMYHSVSFWELLLTNFAIFFMINLLQLVLQTLTVNFFLLGTRETSPLTQRIRQREIEHPMASKALAVLCKIVGYVAVVALSMIILYCYQFELQSGLPARMLVIAGLFVVCGILYLIGKRRYCPEYI